MNKELIMTKNNRDNLQRELKEKIKEGIKPSQLKKSKSLTDLNQSQPKPETIAHLEKELALAQSQLEPLSKLVEKQDKELQELKTELKEKSEKINELTAELDKSLEKRLANLKELLTSEQTAKLQSELTNAKNKISLLESTLKLQRYNNSWLDEETWMLVFSFLITSLLFYYSTKKND